MRRVPIVLILLAACGRSEDVAAPNLPPAPPPRKAQWTFAPAAFCTTDHLRQAGFPPGAACAALDSTARHASYEIRESPDRGGMVFAYAHDDEEQARARFREGLASRPGVSAEDGAYAVVTEQDGTRIAEAGRVRGRLSVVVRLHSRDQSPGELESRARTLAAILAP